MSPAEHAEGIDVLLVEDDPGDVLLIQEAFADSNVNNRLHSVADGVEALAFLRQEGEFADVPRPTWWCSISTCRARTAARCWPR